MLSAILIAPSEPLARSVHVACADLEDLCLYKILPHFPAPYELVRVMQTFSPEVVFLEIASWESGMAMAQAVRSLRPGAQLIGFAKQCGREQRIEASEAGIGEILPMAFAPEEFQAAVSKVLDQRRSEAPGNLVAFVPAKAGSGSTTTALNLAGFLARQGRKVLFVDADIDSGVVSVLLNLSEGPSLLDVLDNPQSLADPAWDQLPIKMEGLDVLPAPRIKKINTFSPISYRRFLSFVNERYKTVIVDLPDVPNELTHTAVALARVVYVVCTPEMGSLFLAQRRIGELRDLGVSTARIDVVLNRHSRKDPPVEKLAEALERRIGRVLPEDNGSVREALREGRLVEAGSELGRAFSAFARSLGGDQIPSISSSALQFSLGRMLRRRVLERL